MWLAKLCMIFLNPQSTSQNSPIWLTNLSFKSLKDIISDAVGHLLLTLSTAFKNVTKIRFFQHFQLVIVKQSGGNKMLEAKSNYFLIFSYVTNVEVFRT